MYFDNNLPVGNMGNNANNAYVLFNNFIFAFPKLLFCSEKLGVWLLKSLVQINFLTRYGALIVTEILQPSMNQYQHGM